MLKILTALFLLTMSISTSFAAGDSAGFSASKMRVMTVFTSKTCFFCKQEIAYLKKHRIRYVEVPVETEDGQLEYFDAGGNGGTPLSVLGGQALHGFNEKAMEKFLLLNQYPRDGS